MSDFTDFFPTAGATGGGGGGGGTEIINGITVSTPYKDLTYAPTGVYRQYNNNDPSGTAVDTSYSTTTNNTSVVTTPTVYSADGGTVTNTLVSFTTANSPNGGAIMFAQSDFKSQANGVATCLATGPTVIVTIDGVATTFSLGINVYSGTSLNRTADLASFILGALPIGFYNQTIVNSGAANTYGVGGYGGGLLNQSGFDSVQATTTPNYLNDSASGRLNATAPAGNRWFGYGLPWIRWTTSITITQSCNLSSIDNGGKIRMGGVVQYKHFG
jgi:hypothetical protein